MKKHLVTVVLFALLTVPKAAASDESPVRTPLISADSSPEILAVAAQLGVESATADIKANRLRILEYGQPRLVTESTKDPATSFRIQVVAGCVVTLPFTTEVNAYNRTMREWYAKNSPASTSK